MTIKIIALWADLIEEDLMEFRDLRKQYSVLKTEIDSSIQAVIEGSNFIQGSQVKEFEKQLAGYVGIKYCISCANGTDALQLALMAWNIGRGDAVFVPDFTFFSSGEIVSAVGATPIFVDVDADTLNIDTNSLEKMIRKTITEGKLSPKVIVAVDLFGQPAEYDRIREIANQYHLLVLEDAAQGLGGDIAGKKAGSFGDISTTSFFPAKPLGCYGDGGAIFTDHEEWASILQSLRVHGKGESKYDNVRIGMNSRLDTLQAAILLAKLPTFVNEELDKTDKLAKYYTISLQNYVKTPVVKEKYFSSWAQYTIQLENWEVRDGLQRHLNENNIPTAVYYQKPMHKQLAFAEHSSLYNDEDYHNTNKLCETVLSLPFHPYMEKSDAELIVNKIIEYLE